MDGVAVVAGNPFNPVAGHVPEGQIALPGVTVQALGRFRLGGGQFLAEDEDPHPSLTALFHMGRARTVTGFTPFLICRAAGDTFFGMG